MLYQNLKVAFRNLMKYKVQALLSIASIAIGIVTLSLAFSVMTRFSLPSIMSQPYKDRAYELWLKKTENDNYVGVSLEALKALKRDGGLQNAEQIATLNGSSTFPEVEFHLMDSTVRKGNIGSKILDPEYVSFIGLRSAITGKKIKRLKKGEAIVSELYTKELFGDANPIGAVQALANYTQPFPVTVVDVYEESSLYNPHFRNGARFLFCLEDNIEDFSELKYISLHKVYVVMKEGSTEDALIEEMNRRLKPLGLETELRKVVNDAEMNRLILTHAIVYILSSLILLAAIIGFLSMQMQLFWLRFRDISLRIVNGAKRRQLFGMLITEVSVTVILAITLSIILGYLLEDFLGNKLGFFVYYELTIRNLWIYSLSTGGILLLICGIVTWIMIRRVCNIRRGLAKNLHRNRRRLLRNVLLGIQVAICIVFVCTTFILINGGRKLLDNYNVPDNNSAIQEYLYIMPWESSNPHEFIEKIDQLPDLDKRIMSFIYYGEIKEVTENPEASQKYYGRTHMKMYFTNDTTLLSVLGTEVEWFNRDIDRTNCLLIGEDYYNQFRELGIINNNTLTLLFWSYPREIVLPIGGIIKKDPYNNNTEVFVGIFTPYNPSTSGYMLIPKPGRGNALTRGVTEVYEEIDPGKMDIIVQNFRNRINSEIETEEAVTTLGWILGIVSVIICAMSILSTIMLDTRSRKKEVAIRRVNGAKSIDIYRLFGRVYLVIVALAAIVAIPVCVIFNGFVESFVKDHSTVEGFSPLWPIILAISIIALLILAIVGWQTRKTLRIDPAKIIAKE